MSSHTRRPYSDEYFWERVERGEPDECWPWQAAVFRSRGGYGAFRDADGKTKRAHVRAFELTNGPVPPGLKVLHSCDNPPCCNPRHLKAGTALDNVNDMDSRGRRVVVIPKGLSHHSNKLTITQVQEIRARASEGLRPLAREFGVTHATVQRIIERKIWKEVS